MCPPHIQRCSFGLWYTEDNPFSELKHIPGVLLAMNSIIRSPAVLVHLKHVQDSGNMLDKPEGNVMVNRYCCPQPPLERPQGRAEMILNVLDCALSFAIRLGP